MVYLPLVKNVLDMSLSYYKIEDVRDSKRIIKLGSIPV